MPLCIIGFCDWTIAEWRKNKPLVTVWGWRCLFVVHCSAFHCCCVSADKNLRLSTLLRSWDVFLDFSPLIFSTSHLSRQLSPTLYLLRLLRCCTHFHTHTKPLFPLLLSPASDEGRVQQEVHLHLYHTCNVLGTLAAGLNSVVSACHFRKSDARHLEPSSLGSFHMMHKWRGTAFNATCTVCSLSSICISSHCWKIFPFLYNFLSWMIDFSGLLDSYSAL